MLCAQAKAGKSNATNAIETAFTREYLANMEFSSSLPQLFSLYQGEKPWLKPLKEDWLHFSTLTLK